MCNSVIGLPRNECSNRVRHYACSGRPRRSEEMMTSTIKETTWTEHDNDAIVMPVNDALAIDYQTGYGTPRGNDHGANFANDATVESILRG